MSIAEEYNKKIQSIRCHIEKSQKMLQDHENGIEKLSLMAQASAESSIEKNTYLLQKYMDKLRRFTSTNKSDSYDLESNKEEIIRRNYFKYQVFRIKRDKTKTPEEIESALLIYNELPDDVEIEDDILYTIGNKTRELFLDIHSDLDDELLEIKNEFLKAVESSFDETNNELKLLNYRIPIIVLQLKRLMSNLHENIDEFKLPKFRGLPRFQDWWIEELWESHQAYIALCKWKKIVVSLFVSHEQQYAVKTIFKNWLMIKKILNLKGEVGYAYNKAFDDLIAKYTNLHDEQNEVHLESIKSIVLNTTREIELLKYIPKQREVDEYTLFKKEKKGSE